MTSCLCFSCHSMLDRFVFAVFLMEKKQEIKEDDLHIVAASSAEQPEEKPNEHCAAACSSSTTSTDMPFSAKDRKESLKREESSGSRKNSLKNQESGSRKNSLKNQESGSRKNSLIKTLLGKRDSLTKKRDSASEQLEQLSQAQIPQLISSAPLVGDRRAAVSEADQDQRETLKESLEYIQRMEYLQEFQIM